MKPAIFPSERLLAIDDLDRAIVNLSTHINAATYELLVFIRQFDERAGWLRWSFLNCADWLHWRCDLSVGAAREKVRVAHALKTLPVVSAAFRAGESWSARQADALVNMAKAYLGSDVETSPSTSQNHIINLHVEHSALTHGKGRAGLPIESVKRIACDSDKVTIVDDEHGEPLSVGRKTRIVPTAIKRALQTRDKGCVFPGCHHRRFVDAHHVQHWSAGGETSLENLLLLCSRHHRLVHEGGYRIDKDYRHRWIFKRPDGIAVPNCGYRAEETIDKCREPQISYLGRDSAESFLSRLEKQLAAPPH